MFNWSPAHNQWTPCFLNLSKKILRAPFKSWLETKNNWCVIEQGVITVHWNSDPNAAR